MIFSCSVVILITFSFLLVECGKFGKNARKKRYLTFPEGSTFSAALCLTVQTIGPAQIFTEAIAWGVAYDLPNDTSTFKHLFFPKHVLQRRHRRDLYKKLETLMISMGLEGKMCILKALCEVGHVVSDKRVNLVEELLWIIFSIPTRKLSLNELDDLWEYHSAYKTGKEENVDCSRRFWQCPYSVIDLFFGLFKS